MEKTSPASSAARRSFISAVVVATASATAVLVGSCGTEKGLGDEPIVNNASTIGAGTNNGAGNSNPTGNGGPTGSNGGVTTGSANGDTATATNGGGVTPGNAGTPSATGAVTDGSGAAGSELEGAGAAAPSGQTAAEPCVDIEPPPDPEWPDATCASWAAETEECSAAWFSKYCDLSCGRCMPEGGAMSGAPEPEPCEDVVPPPDPEWPDATCEEWATETEECTADWFANYCDISCGRCVPEGGAMASEPEPEVCEDVLPPPDPEWPDATCAEWASETEECSADWFAGYCDISCGRCIPEGGLPPEPMGPDCSGEGLPNVTGGEGYATRYWDCCQPHCAQSNGHKCGQDGTSVTGDSNSACSGGGAYACYDEAPRKVSDCLSYGHIAKSNPNCGACYRIQFTGQGEYNDNDPGSKLIKGKQMVLKVTNTGGDVAGNQFDLMIPGGGVGQFNACSKQWGTNDLGAQYGGFLTDCSGSHAEKKECVREQCMKIPAGSARDGCIWFVDWLEVADNPKFTSQQTDCPF